MAVKICPNCGGVIPASRNVCIRCKHKLVSSDVEPASAPVVDSSLSSGALDASQTNNMHSEGDGNSVSDFVNAAKSNPNINLILPIVSVIMFWPLGLVAIVMYILSNLAWKQGNEALAKSRARIAKICAIAAIAFFVLMTIL